MAASSETLPDILSEGWLWWLPDKELKKSGFSRDSDGWKSYYFYITSWSNCANVLLYKKAPRSKKDKPHVAHVYHTFQLHKQSGVNKHRTWLCEVINEKRQSSYYAFENEARRDSFGFFMITQRCLPSSPTSGKVYIVDPEHTDSHRKIGSRGSTCLLHICKSGVTLAFKSSGSIVAQWPLNSIRNYESTGEGCFQIEAGRRSPMGEGVYRFSTRKGEDALMYALFDRYITEAVEANKKVKQAREEKIYEEYTCLRVLANTHSDSKHSRELKRISDNNFASTHELVDLSAGGESARSSTVSNGHIPDTKLSDVEHWLEERPSRPSRLPLNSDPTTPPKLPNSAKPTSLRRPNRSNQSLPVTPNTHNALSPGAASVSNAAVSPNSIVPINILRQRSKTTEDPLSLPSLDEHTEYLHMAASIQSLNILSDTTQLRKTTNQNPSALSPSNGRHPVSASHKSLAQLSLSPSSVSKSLDMDTGVGRGRMQSESPSMAAFSPSMKSLRSIGLSTISLATPPPSFYEAMGLPPYMAPTPPEESVILRNARLSQQSRQSTESSTTDSGVPGNTLPLPPKMLRKQLLKSQSTRSAEDLTQLVRGSLVLSPSQEKDIELSYENAMFNNELLQSMERSTDLTSPTTYIPGTAVAHRKPPSKLSVDIPGGDRPQLQKQTAVRYSSGDQQSIASSCDIPDSPLTDSYDVDAPAPCSTATNQHYTGDNLQQYHLATEITGGTDVVPDSPRQISTYLYDKSEEHSQSYDNSTPSSSPAGGITEAEVRERAKNYTKPISPYCTVELSAETNHYIADQEKGPPPVPDVPRPFHINRDNTDTAKLRDRTSDSNAGASNSNRETLAYEQIDYSGSEAGRIVSPRLESNSSTLSSSGKRSGPDVYERVDSQRMLENQSAVTSSHKNTVNKPVVLRENTTTWHIGLAESFEEHTTLHIPESSAAQAVPAGSGGVRRGSSQSTTSQRSVTHMPIAEEQEYGGYMTPVLSPAHGVVLPLPPPETGEESEEENTSVWSGFGTIRRMFSEMSRSKLRRSKSTDMLSASNVTQQPSTSSANKPSIKPASHNTQARISKRKSKNKSASSKATGEFQFIQTTPNTKEYRKSDKST